MPADEISSAVNIGTRFLLFPQTPTLTGYGEAERVWLSPAPGAVGAGPSDERMYVIDPLDKAEYYEYPYMPPFVGEARPPVEPSPEGHFDHLRPDSRDFACAHLYGSVRRVLDVWESYAGHEIQWFFKDDYQRMELVPLLEWHNAQSGYGFMEFGYMRTETGDPVPHALNFDVIAHETGHTIMFSEMGVPAPDARTREFYGFHEAGADLTALIAALHFDSVCDRLLRNTHGNLYTLNELNRIAEISDNKQIRIAANARRMSDVTDEVHDLSRPLTGAIFDILAEIFLTSLSREGLIDQTLARDAVNFAAGDRLPDRIQAAFDDAYKNRHFAFKASLHRARDAIGQRLALVWSDLDINALNYAQVAEAILAADRRLGGGEFERAIVESFAWRDIAVAA